MKITRWSVLKSALIVALTIALVTYQVGDVQEAWMLGLSLALGFGLIGLFQLVVWFFYDVVTLKRGGWTMPSFGDSPFRWPRGVAFHLGVEAVALLTFGVAESFSGIIQGWPAVILGVWLVATGGLLLVWQRLLRRVFKSRFAEPNEEAGAELSEVPRDRIVIH
jgi:hypothetical protein